MFHTLIHCLGDLPGLTSLGTIVAKTQHLISRFFFWTDAMKLTIDF